MPKQIALSFYISLACWLSVFWGIVKWLAKDCRRAGGRDCENPYFQVEPKLVVCISKFWHHATKEGTESGEKNFPVDDILIFCHVSIFDIFLAKLQSTSVKVLNKAGNIWLKTFLAENVIRYKNKNLPKNFILL